MTNRTTVVTTAGNVVSSTPDPSRNPLGLLALVLLSAWCGLIAGLLEVGATVIRKRLFDPDQLYKMSRHFVWLIPLSNLCLFLIVGVLGSAVVWSWPRHGRWLLSRLLGALTALPALLVAFPRIYSLAWVVVALGMATQLMPRIERRSRGFRRFVLVSFPVAIAVVAILGAPFWMSDRIKQRRESARALPPPGSPNVLLIVMDTVAAGHLGLNGYHRATSTTMAELAARGIRFDSARATSSWTLPSHASMFTGRWLHELRVGWLTPLDGSRLTLAEFLGGRGYATAGFVANTTYCGIDSGLARGFTLYRDFIFPNLTLFKMAALVNRGMDGFQTITYFTEDWLESAGVRPHVERLWQSLENDRKGAARVNHELLDWLSRRTQPERPFFAFLNYFDAHFPYQVLPGRIHRFGVEPTDNHQRVLIQHWWDIDKATLSPEGVAFAADAYDDCIADLDEQLGKLVDELDRRGVLERTWLIIASDHGESFGEHAGVFCHGSSLYETELHVPLLVIPPGSNPKPQAVTEGVSLRDMAATIVELAGFAPESPFPGDSLSRYWKTPVPSDRLSSDPALAEVVPIDPHRRDDWGLATQLAPLGTIKGRDWSYIRRDDDAREELFYLHDDPKEQRNLADNAAAAATLEQMRAILGRLTGGPLRPQRFSR